MKVSHTEEFVVRTYEIDNQKKATIPALVKLMHEAAMQNVIQLNLSVWDLEPHHISWVLMRKWLRISELPKLGDQIKVFTTPAGFEKFFTYRDYKVFNQKGELLAASSSTWLLMDTQKRKMTRIPEFILAMQPHMPKLEDTLERPKVKLAKFEKAEWIKNYQVNWHDLDFNLHLNNTYYIQWMLEALPDEILMHHQMKSIDIIYRAESLWKDQVVSQTQSLGNKTYLHQLIRKRDEKELAFAKTIFHKK